MYQYVECYGVDGNTSSEMRIRSENREQTTLREEGQNQVESSHVFGILPRDRRQNRMNFAGNCRLRTERPAQGIHEKVLSIERNVIIWSRARLSWCRDAALLVDECRHRALVHVYIGEHSLPYIGAFTIAQYRSQTEENLSLEEHLWPLETSMQWLKTSIL